MNGDPSRPSVAAPARLFQPLWHLTRRRPSREQLIQLLGSRYGGLPTWVLIVQIFLAAGWLRAALAHGLSAGWWNGAELAEFTIEHETAAVEWYKILILDGLVAWTPLGVAIVVMAAQLVVTVLLALHVRTLIGLGLGAFLNVNFILAGAVNPSTFYLMLGAALAMWHVEAAVNTPRCWWLTLVSTVVGFTFVGSLAPQITTFEPADVIDDPAIVLSFISLLWIAGLWVTFGRRVMLHNAERNDQLVEPGAGASALLTRNGKHAAGRATPTLEEGETLDVSDAIVFQLQQRVLELDELDGRAGFDRRRPLRSALYGYALRSRRGHDEDGLRLDPEIDATQHEASSDAEPVVFKPESFAEAKLVADEFMDGVPVLLDLGAADRNLACRLMNFAIGICYSLDGRMEKVSPQVFLLLPNSVEVSDENRRRLGEHSYAR